METNTNRRFHHSGRTTLRHNISNIKPISEYTATMVPTSPPPLRANQLRCDRMESLSIQTATDNRYGRKSPPDSGHVWVENYNLETSSLIPRIRTYRRPNRYGELNSQQTGWVHSSIITDHNSRKTLGPQTSMQIPVASG